jgi:hypothetical protein
MMEALDNAGFALLETAEAEPPPAACTIVVLGASRGGTSVCAGILGHLGLFMGESGEAPMYEDLFLNRAVRDSDETAFLGRLSQYNQQHAVWGYKGTILNRDLSRYHGMFRNPRYLVVFRDVLAIAMRASASAGHPVDAVMARQLNEYARIVEFLRHENPAALLVSFEKLQRDPRPIIDAIANFAAANVEPELVERAAAFAGGPDDTYFQVSRKSM